MCKTVLWKNNKTKNIIKMKYTFLMISIITLYPQIKKGKNRQAK